MTNYRCLVLDHDDTTVDSTRKVNYPQFCQFVPTIRPDFHFTEEEYIATVGEMGFYEMVTHILHYTEEEREAHIANWKQYLKTHRAPFFPGMPEIIRRQKEEGGIVCVVSHSYEDTIRPLYDYHGVTQPDLVESLSIPVQQVARVIVEGCELTEEEAELIGRVVDIEEVPELYRSHISDNIKNEIRSKDNAYFEENAGQYLNLWLRLLMKHPVEFVKAWVDQTKGYWGGGFRNWMYGNFVNENDMGIAMKPQSNIVNRLFGLYFGLSRNLMLFEPLHSIGLHVWILAIAAFVALFRKRKEWILIAPLLAMVLTLLVATPVSGEFRYAYSLFTAFPLVICACLYGYPEESW